MRFLCRLTKNLRLLFLLPTAAFATDVLTWHNDPARTGQNLEERVLIPASVNSDDFGKLFDIPVDGKVDAQPLIVTGLTIPNKGTHNVVFIATEHDSLYACDADDGSLLWKAKATGAGERSSDDRGCSQVTPEIGITSTPVIDRNAGPHGIVYLVAMSKDAGGNYFQRLHAFDLTTGAEMFGGPVEVTGIYPGTGDNSSNGMVVFDPKQYKERAGLVLDNGVVYLHWSSHCDHRPYTGWVMGYDATTLAQVSVFNLTPNGTHGAVWQSGAAPALDPAGNIYFLDADGTFETTLNGSGFPNNDDFGNCFVKLSTANNTVQVADYFTMYNTEAESGADQDLGSGGAIVLPDMTDAGGVVRKLAVGGGKDRHLYLVNRSTMGKFVPGAASNFYVYQDLFPGFAAGLFSTPAYFNGRLYVGPVGDTLQTFTFTNAKLATIPSSVSDVTFGYPGTTPAISANGNTNGIVWVAQNTNPAVLHAYDAKNLATELYNTNQASNERDHFGIGNKFIVPTIANGKVYVGTTNSVGVFGLLDPPRFANIATRASIGTGNDVLIGGFIVRGGQPKDVIVRAIGPSLEVGGTPLPDRLADPKIELHGPSGLVMTNDNWMESPNKTRIMKANLAPDDPLESAIFATLAPGEYTAIVSGADGGSGVGLVEAYDLSTAPAPSRFANISSRGFVGTADDVLIGGIIVRGVAQQPIVFRAIGPDVG
ncbi:MAG TPA: hypothetical protein VGI85_13660, partial [Chthoniobacterales bacterium]